MKFYETICLILLGLATLSIAAPVASEDEASEFEDPEAGDEPGDGF